MSIVAFPCANTPLHIFEARYRVLFTTLLHGSDGLEEGLANESSPFLGSRKFGMCFVNSEGGLAATGTMLEIVHHDKLDDGRMLINSVGRQRFRITNVVQEAPIVICEVELLDEDGIEEDTPALRALAGEVVQAFKDVIRLNFKARKLTPTKEALEPKELEGLVHPRDISFWVASMFGDSRLEQQLLLEMPGTQQRLEREKEVLEETLKWLSAQVQWGQLFRPV